MKIKLDEAKPHHFASYRDKRIKDGNRTCQYDLVLLRAAWNKRIFPITDVAVRQAWDRLRRRAGITDLTFHDLRHEAVSRQFESGLSIPQVMAISGHQTVSQLFRYVNLSDNDPVNI